MASRRGERVNEADPRSAGGDFHRQGREWRAFLMNAIDRPFREVKQDTVRKLFPPPSRAHPFEAARALAPIRCKELIETAGVPQAFIYVAST